MDETSSAALMLPCPVCGRSTDRLKCFRLATTIFLIVGARVQWRDEVGCPACIRAAIGRCAALNLLTAHVIWPFVTLPQVLVQLVRSYQPGHSPAVLERVQGGRPAPGDQGRSGFVAGLGGLVLVGLGLALLAGSGLALLSNWYSSEGAWPLLLLACACGGGVAFALVFGGGCWLSGKSPRAGPAGKAAAAGVVVFLLVAPLGVGAAWRHRERSYDTANLLYEYGNTLPPQLWRAEALGKLVDWRVAQLQREPDMDFARRELENTVYSIRRYHGGEEEFQPLLKKAEAILAVPPPTGGPGAK